MNRICQFLTLPLILLSSLYLEGEEYALRVGWLVDGTGAPARTHTVLLVRNGRILALAAEVPSHWKSPVLDFSADTAIPGLVDAHGHIVAIGLGEEADERLVNRSNQQEWALRNARVALASGITTLRDPGTYPWTLGLRKQIEQTGPRWITAGQQLVKRAPNAYMSEMFMEFDGPEEARAKVRELHRQGAEFIKLRFTKQRPMPTLEEARAVVGEAHRLGLKVAVHTDVPDDDAVRLAVAAGADSLEHNAALRLKNPEAVWRQLADRGIIVVPGMGSWQARVDCLSTPAEGLIEEPLRSKLFPELRTALVERGRELREQIRGWMKDGWDPVERRKEALQETLRVHAAGVLLATGPDTGVDMMPHGRLYKDAFWYAEAGLPIEEVMRIATLNGARAAGCDHEVGSLEPGKRADVVVLRGSLLEDYRRLKDVVLVIRGGQVVFDASRSSGKQE
jgi:imidazolonepropionase-like amidohydrolase